MINPVSEPKAIFCSNDEELYNAFRRALKYLPRIDLIKYSGRFNKLNVVIYAMENDEIDSWLWGQFRRKSRSPLLIFGFEEKGSFISKNPVFAAYPDEHAYFQIPFDVRNFIDKMQNMKPIHDDVTRRGMVDGFSRGYEHKLVTHDLKIIRGDKTASINTLLEVQSFYHSKGDSETAKIIDKRVKDIESQDDWEQIALDCRTYLIERLARKI